jgi:polysaccharide deacetylase family sporulation protein PdaB
MIIYAIRLRRLVRYLIIIVAAVVAGVLLGTAGKGAIEVFSQKRELPIYSVESTEKKVAITFDCAWGADDIPDILSTLRKEDVKATFFIVGQWAEKFPDKVKMMAEDGHDIANHSYSHLRMGVLDKGRISKEISLCGEKLAEITGNKIELFRPPYGEYNNDVILEAKALGYYTIQWDVDSLDWKPEMSSDAILSRVTEKVKPGSIILFHNDTKHTAKILPSIIKALKEDGYTFEPVSRLILRENYFIDYDGKQKMKK